MPYIPQDERETAIHSPRSAGQLNFAISQLITAYIDKEGLCYQTINDVVGVMECCKAEFYAMVVRPYEDEKRASNGDVWGGFAE